MPENKQAAIRYRVINRMLSGGKTASKQQLADACSRKLDKPVSLRTIENDLWAMRYSEGLGYYAPVEYDRVQRGYRYTGPDYSIDRLPVCDEDLRKLMMAAALLRQYRVEAFRDFSGAIDKVIRLINYRKLHSGSSGLPFIEFEKNPPVRGMEYIGRLIPVIRRKRVIRITHHSFWQEEVNTFTVHPFYLKEYKFRWYLVGYCEERDDVRIYGLERITGIEEMPLKTFTPRTFNPELYFDRFIGVNVPQGQPEKITLRFKNRAGKYFLTQPLHHSQALIAETATTHDFTLHLAVNHEFKGIILSWADSVEVLEPRWLREEIRQVAERMAEAHRMDA
ncbi:MAG: helix-turn-helix transcriptional regulator [Bacteroidales bacterium]